MIQNPDQRVFSGNTENTPFISISSGVDLKIDQDRNHETRNIENFEDDNFSSLRLRYDRQLITTSFEIYTKPNSTNSNIIEVTAEFSKNHSMFLK